MLVCPSVLYVHVAPRLCWTCYWRRSGWVGRTDGGACRWTRTLPSGHLLIGDDPTALRMLLQDKLAAQQTFGLRLWWEGGQVGGEFLVFPNCDVTFSPTINRVTLGERTTDVSWYLSRLLPLFEQEGAISLESWTWQETG